MTQEGVSEALGVSRSSVANSLRLLSLDAASLAALRAGDITEGHARALLSVSDLAARGRLLAAIKQQGLSVRDAERWAEGAGRRNQGNRRRDGHQRMMRRGVARWGVRSIGSSGTWARGCACGAARSAVGWSWSTTARRSWRRLIDRLTAA